MTFTTEQLNSARKEGYSDDEIWEYLGGQDKGFSGAKQEGYSLDEVAGYFGSLPTGTSLTKEIEQLGPAFIESIGRPLESMGESFEVLGFQGVADALKGAITEPENYVSAAQRFMEPKEDEAQFLGFAWQYAPRAAVEQAGQAIGSLATRVAGGIAGAPLGPAGVAAGAFVGPAIFEAAQIIGPVAKERAQNNGREVPTNEDILAATLTATGSGALNAIGAKYLPGGEKATGKFFKRVASSFLGEAATEAPQSIIEQVGSTAGTEAGLNVNLKQAVGEGLIGGTTGAGLTGITAPFTKAAEDQVVRTPEQAEEIDIEAKANEEAVSLLGAPADQAKNAQITKVKELEAVIANNEMLEQALEPNDPEAKRLRLENKVARTEIEKAKVELEESVGLAPVEDAKQVQSRIEKSKVELVGLEPTSRKAKALEAQIAQDEAKVTALSEPITTVEAEQARLAREIAAPVEEAAPVEPAAEVVTPTAEPAPVEPTPVAEAPATAPTPVTTPPVTEAVTPTAPAVGNRIKLGRSPQPYTIEEVIPQTENDKKFGEQYYNVRNERTGKVQTVEAKDLKPIKKMPIRKAISDPIPTPPERRVNFDDIIDTVQDMFGKEFVAGRLYVMDDVNEKAKAGYDPEDGRIYLNEAYMDTDDSIRDLIAHELGHYIAGDPTMRPKFQEFLDSLPKNERARLERFVDRVYDDQTGEIRLEEKEVRAFIMRLNAGDNRNIFQKMLDALKKWLNEKLGTKFKMTDRDALAILSGAIARFKAGEFIERKEDGTRYARVERSEDVQEDIARAEKIQSVVNDTISKMPQDQGRDYNAYVNEGKSEAEIAKETGREIKDVRVNIVRGRKEVGDAIKKAKIDTKAKPENIVLEWTTGAVKKYLTKEGDLPGATFQKWVKRNAKLAREAEEARQATQDFYDGLRKIYKINKLRFIWEGLSSIPPEDVARFNDALAGEIPITDLPAEIQDSLTRMRQHIDAMSAELIATGQLPEYLEAKAMNNLGVYLTRSYKIFSDPDWIKNIPQEKLNAARNFLYQQQSKTDPNFTIEDADRKLEQMLNDWAGERGMEGKRGGRLGAKDLSVMMTRSEVPKQLRDVMGENTNVIFNYANTIAKISRFVADQRFLEAVKQEGAGEFLFTKDAAPAGFNTLIAPEESRTMAPLSGLRTTPEIAKAFEEFGKAYDAKANPFLYTLGWLNAVGKANLTVGSLFTQARNMIGQPFFFLANGHSDISVINKEVNKIMKDKGMSKEQARNELIKMAAGEALVNENAYAGELKDAFEQLGLKTFEDMDADEFSRQFALTRLFKKGTQGAQKVYQKTDELGKLIGWLNETKRVQSMNPGMSRQEAMSVAAERTRNTYPTYSNSSEAMRLFRRQPFFGPFATFFYETFRTTYWNVKYAFEDINSGTEAGKKAGIARLSGTMAQISIGAFAVNAISAMMAGIGDQEEEDVRRMLPPWAQNASLVWFQKNKDGVYNFINFSSLNPYNALSDPFVTMMSGFSRGEDPTEIFVNSASTFLTPFTSEQPVTAAAIDAARNVTERGTKVYNEEDDLTTKTSKILLHIFGKAFTPGTIDRLRKRIIPAVKGETVSSRAPEPYKEIAAEFTGVRFENLDMRQAFQNKAWEFNKAQNDSERIFRDVATRRRIVTEEEQIDAYRRAEQSRYQNWQDMYRNYMALRRAGASKSEAVRLMTDIKISQREASYIARGKYVPYEVSDEVRRRSKLNGNTVPLKEIKAIAKEMPRVLEDVK